MTLAWPDLIIGGITLFFAIKGFQKGFVSELAGAVAVFVAIIAAFNYSDRSTASSPRSPD